MEWKVNFFFKIVEWKWGTGQRRGEGRGIDHMDGAEHSLDTYIRKVVVVSFFFSHFGLCYRRESKY